MLFNQVVEDLMEEITEEDVEDFVLPTPKVDTDGSTSYKDTPVLENKINNLKFKFEDDDSDVIDASFDMSMDV